MSNKNAVENARTGSGERANESKNGQETPATVSDTLFGTDPPIEEEHPGLQPALVFASYPIALIILVSILGIYFVFFRSRPETEKNIPAQVESRE